MEEAFQALIRRVRAGDAAAAAELVQEYAPEIQRTVRFRLTDPRLRRLLDSMDICQSVLGNFFVRVAAGQFELEQPEQLIKLLMTMAHNKIRDHGRRQNAARRDQHKIEGGNELLDAVADSVDSPSRIVAGRDLLEAMRRQLSDEERYLAEQRALGREWSELAAELQSSPEALRKRLARAIDRAARALGVDEAEYA